jgi:hypothetical protein
LLRNAETAATLLPFVTVDGSEAPVVNPEFQQYLSKQGYHNSPECFTRHAALIWSFP